MIPGKATAEGTAAFAKRNASAHPEHWRQALGLTLSSFGMGSYLGNADPVTDGKYAAATEKALASAVNVIDSAINYRFQRSERNIGTGLKQSIDAGAVRREEVLLCTKGGFIAGDWGPATREWFNETYAKTGILQPGDIVAGCHCITPKYLKHEVDQSRANLGVETIDVYHVHNPETQMPEVGPEEYYKRLTDAFRALEECAAEGKIQYYGTATWHAYRVEEGTEAHVSLEKTVACARAAGGENHRFRAVQFPFNLAMPEANLQKTQGGSSALAAAKALGLAVFTSVPLMQGQLIGRFSKDLKAKFPGLTTDAQRCIQFVRSTPGILAPVPGMKTLEHVEENVKVASVAPFGAEEYAGLLSFLGA
ncbi:MAG TPA: aldo/keto reductase [Planctomycetota bacterium]|nr:aldo/keto reductase [Planctomycetota bacterium]